MTAPRTEVKTTTCYMCACRCGIRVHLQDGAVRWAFLALVFPVPALLLAWGGNSAAALTAAFVLQYAGLLAERWYFFAEANHPQNLYYQAIA